MRLLILLLLLSACSEDLGGTRRLEVPQAEEVPEGEAPDTIRVLCFAIDETELLYLIRGRESERDVANCTGTRESEACEPERIDLELTSTGNGPASRPCLSQRSDHAALTLCLSNRDDPPNDASLVRMTGHEFEMVFEFVCEEAIRGLLR